MRIVEGKEMVTALRSASDRAPERLWVASPYIGSWPGNVRRIMGANWQRNVKDVRLLTDVEAQGFRLSTLRQFFRRGTVRTLVGLHAKLYIADSFVLLTSANLTGAAFSRRYEAGLVITGKDAQAAANLFRFWWEKAKPVYEQQLRAPRTSSKEPDETGSRPLLPRLTDLPSDVDDEPLPSDSFGDYDSFLHHYRDLATRYQSIQRLWRTPLYFEIDAFLDYLYHRAADRPSRQYAQQNPRQLTETQRNREITKYAIAFARAWRNGNINSLERSSRSERSKVVRQLLQRNLHQGLNRSEIRRLLLQLNAMNSYPVNITKAMNPYNNALARIRAMLKDLIDDGVPLQRRLASCSQQVFGLSTSAVQELVGFYYRGRYPLRNKNTNCGLRFFGYEVRVR